MSMADYCFKYVGLNGSMVGMAIFDEPAPADKLFTRFGFTVENVVAHGEALLQTN